MNRGKKGCLVRNNMVISLEEKDGAVIEANGMTIIEFKRILYRRKRINDAQNALINLTDQIVEAWTAFGNRLIKAVDDIKLLFEEIGEIYHYPASFRYKSLKFISKCNGIKKREIWKMTRHTWLARSCC